MLYLPAPYLVFLGNVDNPAYAKTAYGLKDWAGEKCIGEYHLDPEGLSIGLSKMTPRTAKEMGAKAMVIGIASQGGAIDASWVPTIVDAMNAGLDIISGMHSSYLDSPELCTAVEKTGRRFIEIRRPPMDIPIGTGIKRSGKRLLTVGTDCALGKKYTALALHREFLSANIKSTFRATGQTGILISGTGIPIDAVISDFIAGAAEFLSPNNDANHWDIIEGQGSLFHPSYAGVTTGLIHGSQPDAIVLCHDPLRQYIIGTDQQYRIPTLTDAIMKNLDVARLTNRDACCVGISLNTSGMSESAAADLMDTISETHDLPVIDPLSAPQRIKTLIDYCLSETR